ncbi:MAG: hypothetical protein ACRC5T_02810 [Cetobacterium sp.]
MKKRSFKWKCYDPNYHAIEGTRYSRLMGTGVWQGNNIREKVINKEIKIKDGFPVRDIIFQHLTKKFNFDPATAFAISESVRKGKGIKKWKQELDEKLPAWMVESMEQIQYMFPKSHALSYIMSAMRIFYYKIYHPREFYVSALNRYGIGKNNNKNIDYIGYYNSITSVTALRKLHASIDFSTDNPSKSKDNQRIASIIWEMKLRGIILKEAGLDSNPSKFAIDHEDINSILMPLVSIQGVGEGASDGMFEAYKVYGENLKTLNRKELGEVTIMKNDKLFKPFNKKVLDALFGEITIVNEN